MSLRNKVLDAMIKARNYDLLKTKGVVEEINRHRWIESEKAGKDIAFEKAARDWIDRYSGSWLAYHKFKTRSASVCNEKKFTNK